MNNKEQLSYILITMLPNTSYFFKLKTRYLKRILTEVMKILELKIMFYKATRNKNNFMHSLKEILK